MALSRDGLGERRLTSKLPLGAKPRIKGGTLRGERAVSPSFGAGRTHPRVSPPFPGRNVASKPFCRLGDVPPA